MVEILVEQHKQILALDELANHRANSVVATLRHHSYRRVRQLGAHARNRCYPAKRHDTCKIGLLATIRMLCLAAPEPRIDREPVLDVDQHVHGRREELDSRSTVTLVEQRPPKFVTGFVIQLATRRHGSNVVDSTRRHAHPPQHRGEHVSFESAQVTGITRAALVGKTKEVDRFRRLTEPNPPANFLWVYSYGGTQDAALNPATDRVADVFPDDAAIAAAGWASQEASDLLAVLGPRLVGVPANRIPAYLKRLAGRRFSEWQAEVDAERTARQRRRHLRLVVDNTRPATETGAADRASGQVDQPRAA